MLGLPKSTEIYKPLPIKTVFDKFKLDAAARRLFDEQISGLAIVSEISPHTVNIASGSDISAVYVISVTLKTPDCDKRNIIFMSNLINQRMLFILEYENSARLAVYRIGKVILSGSKPIDEWELNLFGPDLTTIWENVIAQIGGIELTDDKSLDEVIIENAHREKLIKQIAVLEKKAMSEKQPRRKWEFVEEIKRLKNEVENR